MSEALKELGDHIAQALPGVVSRTEMRLGELMLEASADKVIALLTFLRDDQKCLFKQLIDICGVDWPEREKRFDVVYNLLSLKNNQRIRVKLRPTRRRRCRRPRRCSARRLVRARDL